MTYPLIAPVRSTVEREAARIAARNAGSCPIALAALELRLGAAKRDPAFRTLVASMSNERRS